ncbi:MAG: hypothetical protein KME08_05730 [Aphanothece sp. CMT-3BRIN-NPC111]|jgi:hypothetical protein|nr:hypothetical protein [Aphanothece sp. CMT-3BRIN-NPC111]
MNTRFTQDLEQKVARRRARVLMKKLGARSPFLDEIGDRTLAYHPKPNPPNRGP